MSRITIYLNHVRGHVHIFVQTDCRLAILESKTDLRLYFAGKEQMFRAYMKCIMWKYISTLNPLVIAPYGKEKHFFELNNKMKNHRVGTIPESKYQNREKDGLS